MGTKTDAGKLPKIFYVNWFRKDGNGKWLWPGFGDNSRVLKWIFERVSGSGKAVHTPIGFMPAPDAIEIKGLDVPAMHMEELLTVNQDEWKKEITSVKEYYAGFGDKLPSELAAQLAALEKRMNG